MITRSHQAVKTASNNTVKRESSSHAQAPWAVRPIISEAVSSDAISMHYFKENKAVSFFWVSRYTWASPSTTAGKKVPHNPSWKWFLWLVLLRDYITTLTGVSCELIRRWFGGAVPQQFCGNSCTILCQFILSVTFLHNTQKQVFRYSKPRPGSS